jgi:hypothetical protein
MFKYSELIFKEMQVKIIPEFSYQLSDCTATSEHQSEQALKWQRLFV